MDANFTTHQLLCKTIGHPIGILPSWLKKTSLALIPYMKGDFSGTDKIQLKWLVA